MTTRRSESVAAIARTDAADIARVMELERACFAPHEAFHVADYEGLLGTADAVCLHMDGPAGAMVAFATATFDHEARRGHVVTLNVHPDARRAGHGRTLMEWLEREAQARGMDALELEVRITNIPAITLYEALGYLRVGRIRRYYRGPAPRDAYAYSKEL